MSELTAKRLREVLDYDPNSGLFRWIQPPRVHPRINGYVAGGCSTGYVLIKIDGKKYKAHRLAWLYVHDEWPPGDIEHINGSPLDNRIANLRVATNPQNQANRARDRGKDLPKGVRHIASGKFAARIRINGESKYLGTFLTPEEAESAYLCAAKTYYGDFARAS